MFPEFWTAVSGVIPVVALALVIEARNSFKRNPDRLLFRCAALALAVVLVLGETLALAAMLSPDIAASYEWRLAAAILVAASLLCVLIVPLTGMLIGTVQRKCKKRKR